MFNSQSRLSETIRVNKHIISKIRQEVNYYVKKEADFIERFY